LNHWFGEDPTVLRANVNDSDYALCERTVTALLAF